MEKESAEELFGLLNDCRYLIWRFLLNTPQRLLMTNQDGVVNSLTLISEVVDNMLKKPLRNVDKADDESVFKPWCTFQLLTALLEESVIGRVRFIVDCVGVAGAGLPGKMQRIRMTQAQHSQVWQSVLDMLSTGLVPYTSLVEALSDGNPVQTCYQCGDEVTLVDAASVHVHTRRFFKLVPTIIIGNGLLYRMCGKQRCFENHDNDTSLIQGVRVDQKSKSFIFYFSNNLISFYYNRRATKKNLSQIRAS